MLNENFKRQFLNTSARNTVLQQHCLTATVHERKLLIFDKQPKITMIFLAHDSYTLRTCISRSVSSEGTYPTLCEFIRDHIEHQNYYNGSLSCRQCDDGDFCNEHVLGEGAGLADTTATTTTSTTSSAFVHAGSICVVIVVLSVLL